MIMSKILFRVAAVVGLSMIGATGVAMAANPPSSGLGQAWPNAADVSASPHWHAYVFTLGGVKYIQVNDLNGNVLGAIGTANGQFITLPIGAFSQLVSTPQQPAANTQAVAAAAPAAAPTTVYKDTTTQITATPMSNGTVMLKAVDTGGGGYCDPIVCATQGIR
ncbi:hypothetical protein UU5_17797 [Rhodanobacter sp. 115]|nr:hypothetical protein UU5_17797 [Rhodanobacter sp. 115]